jgi:hypothetical protein
MNQSLEVRSDEPFDHHVPDGRIIGDAHVLMVDALDPDGKIPEFKFCAVRLERGEDTP